MVSISLFCCMIFSKKSATFWDHAPPAPMQRISVAFSLLVPVEARI